MGNGLLKCCSVLKIISVKLAVDPCVFSLFTLYQYLYMYSERILPHKHQDEPYEPKNEDYVGFTEELLILCYLKTTS